MMSVKPEMGSAPVKKPEEEMPQLHRIRITLSSRNVKNLEKVTQRVSCPVSEEPLSV